MYQNCCKNGKVEGDYAVIHHDDVLSKDQLRDMQKLMEDFDFMDLDKYKLNKTKTQEATNRKLIEIRLQKFVEFLDNAIDVEMYKEPLSPEDAIRKNSYCLALERDKNSILNIIEGREFNDSGETK